MKTVENNFHSKQFAALVRGGKDYFDLVVDLIDNAQFLIIVVTYILSEDKTGTEIIDHLANAAKRKVRVIVLVDGYATSLSKKMTEKISSAGIQFYTYAPIKGFDRYIGRRLHEKAIVIDDRYALIGGMNIDNKYNDMPKKNAWLDFAVLIKGEIVQHVTKHCKSLQPSKDDFDNVKRKTSNFEIDPKVSFFECEMRIRKNDWLYHINEISSTYIGLIQSANKSLIILCSYFIPGKILRRTLKYAALRGVNIKVVTAGPSDVKIAKASERWLYDWMLRNRIEIYEYQKNILHGKLAIADGRRMTLGSYNLNDISTYLSMELNVEIIGNDFCKSAEKNIMEIIKNDSKRIDNEIHRKNRSPAIQLLRWVSYRLFRILFIIFTISFKRKSH